MSDLALLVVEAPWFLPKKNSGQMYCLQFFEGVKKAVNKVKDSPNLNIYSCNFYDESSLSHALNHLVSTSEKRQIIYCGAHGDGDSVAEVELKALANSIKGKGQKVKGLILSSCWGGEDGTIALATGWDIDIGKRGAYKAHYGPNWVIAYKHSVDWMYSALFETALVHGFVESYKTDALNSTKSIIEVFVETLIKFNVDEQSFAWDDQGNRVSIRDTVRVWIRGKGATESTERTAEIFSSL
jgi:hypothetical protein